MISENQAMSVIAERVRKYRGDMSYSELARRMTTDSWKCYPATIQQIESGRHMPGSYLLARLAETFECSLDDLFPLHSSKKRPTHTPRKTLSRAS